MELYVSGYRLRTIWGGMLWRGRYSAPSAAQVSNTLTRGRARERAHLWDSVLRLIRLPFPLQVSTEAGKGWGGISKAWGVE